MSTSAVRPTRRGFLVASGVITVAGAAAAAGVTNPVAAAAAAAPGAIPLAEKDDKPDRYDPEQRYLQLVGGGDGVLYGVQADGKLVWHRHTGWHMSKGEWAPGSGRVIGAGWHQFRTVMGAEDGSLFGLRGDGTIVHKRYVLSDPESGAGKWTDLQEVGSGFERFDRVFGYDGYVYGVTETGHLSAFRYDPDKRRLEGPHRTGSGFNATHYGADTDGVIYCYWENGLNIYRYRDDDGMDNGGGAVQIARGIYEQAEFGTLSFAGAGRVYYSGPSDPSRQHEGALQLHLLTNYTTAAADGGAAWATYTPVTVGLGFTVASQANLQGYPMALSVPAGGTLSAAFSTTFAEVSASVVRLAPSGQGPKVVSPSVSVAGALQILRNGYLHQGCGWEALHSVTVGKDWPSGVYAVRLAGPGGLARNLPFVVRPAKPEHQVAVILPTNTYLAYNTWGGHSQYCSCRYLNSGRRMLSFHRPFSYEPAQRGARLNFTLYADLMLLRWMHKEDIEYDVYTDEDLDREADLLQPYRAVVLPTHPEYYSERQRAHLLSFQESGGSTLYLGGNGIYERVTFTDDRSALVFRAANGRRDVYSALGKPASQLLGTNWNPHEYMTFAPYEVLRDHPLLNGTGLKPGATFGMQGVNGPASGGEVDCRMGYAYEADEEEIIARGQNPRHGAEMVLRAGPNGGFLFSVGSLAFSGTVFSSDAVSRLLRNAFDMALEKA